MAFYVNRPWTSSDEVDDREIEAVEADWNGVGIHPNYISSIENKAKEEYESKLLSKKEKLIEKILQNRKNAIQTIIFYLMNFTSKNQFQKNIIIL